MGAKFKGHIVYKGISSLHYTLNLGDMSSHEEEKCFCPKPDKCLKKGVFDAFKCTGFTYIFTRD